MSCNRCYDVHEAQKAGKTQESCKCSCHGGATITWTNHTATAGNWTNVDGTTTFRDWNSTATAEPSFFYNAYTPKCDCDTQPCEKHCDECNRLKNQVYECSNYGCHNNCNNNMFTCDQCEGKEQYDH